MLEIPYGTCYSKTKEEQLPTSGCPHKQSVKVGVVFLCFKTLSDKRKYECQ